MAKGLANGGRVIRLTTSMYLPPISPASQQKHTPIFMTSVISVSPGRIPQRIR